MEQRTITLTLLEYSEMLCKIAMYEEKILCAKRLIQNTDYPRIEDIECILDILSEESEGSENG
jgi:hypothetical protein